jgi:hypothetical protein
VSDKKDFLPGFTAPVEDRPEQNDPFRTEEYLKWLCDDGGPWGDKPPPSGYYLPAANWRNKDEMVAYYERIGKIRGKDQS